MKKIFWAIGGFFALLVAAVLIVPNVIDWNSYKPEISEQVRKVTGRELVIAGDIDLKILPAPALVAEKVSISSIDGAQSPDLASLRRVEVRIALAPLLGGNISVETVRLVEPQIFLEILADGRATWEFQAPKASPEDTAPVTSASAGPGDSGAGSKIAVGNFEIVDGSLTYHDAGSKTHEQIRDIDVNLEAASLTTGPFRARGSFVAKDMRLGIDADIGEIVGGRTFPLDLALMIGGDSAKLNLAGAVLGLDQAPRFKGTLNLTSADVGQVVSALADGAALPAPLGQPLKLSGALDASASSLTLDDLTLDFGGAKGKGKVSGSFNGVPKVTASMTIDKVDADPWLAVGKDQPASAKTSGKSEPAKSAVDKPAAAEGTPAPFALPAGIAASLSFRVGEVSMQGGKFTNAVLNAELANGELNLTQLSLNGPGGSDLAVFGFLTARDGKPAFDGQVQAKVADPQALMTWAGADTSALKPGKPGAITLNVDAGVTPDTVSVRKLGLSFDKTNINGAATVVMRERIGIGASVAVDQIDLDAYLADTPAKEPAPAPKTGEGGTATGEGGDQAPGKTASGPLDALKPLGQFDANVRANVGMLKTQGIPVKDITADISLVAGDLTIRKFSVADALSTGISVSGALLGLDRTPTAKGLAVNAELRDPAKLAALAGAELPVPAKSLGKIDVNAKINGDLMQPSLSSTVKAMAATLEADGDLKLLDPADTFDLGLRFRHADTASLMRRLGTGYRPSGEIGGVDLSTRIKGGAEAFTFSNLAAAIGAVKLNGDGTVRLAGARPKVTATLSTGNVTVDPFLPAKRQASLGIDQPARVMPARFIVPETGRVDFKHLIASVAERWPTTPVDLSGLKAADADITLTSPRISYHEYNLDGAKLLAGIDNGVLNVNEFSGVVFGGSVQSKAKVDASGDMPQLAGLVTLGNMDIGDASKAAGIAGTTGKLTSRIDVNTSGGSVADWVRALGGKGAIEIKGIKGQNSLGDLPVIGLALGPLMQVFEVLNTGLGSLVGAGGKTKIGETDVSSTFTISNGTLNTPDTKIISNLYEGNITGDINLPLWSMNMGGTLAVDQGLLGTVLANVARLPSEIPFQLTGDIDKPNVKIQSFSGSGSAGGEGIKVPGLEKLDKKAPGLGGLIQGILGGGTSNTGQAAPSQQPSTQPPSQSGSSTDGSAPPPQQPAPQQQKRTDPADLLRQLLK